MAHHTVLSVNIGVILWTYAPDSGGKETLGVAGAYNAVLSEKVGGMLWTCK